MVNPLYLNTTFLSLYGAVFFLFMLLFFTIRFTPALTFLMAKFMKKSIKAVRRDDGFIEFLSAKEEAGALIDNKYKIHNIAYDSANIEMKSKIPIYFCNSRTSSSVSTKVYQVLSRLEDYGLNTNTFAEFKDFLTKNKEKIIKTPLFQTFRLCYLPKYLARSQNPHFLDSVVENRVLNRIKNDKRLWLFVFILMAMIVGAIAFAIIMRSKPPAVTIEYQQIPTYAQNLTNIVSGMPYQPIVTGANASNIVLS